MNYRAFVAVLGLLGACAAGANEPDRPKIAQVQPAAFHSLHFAVVDDGSTYMQQLYEQAPSDLPEGVTVERERWKSPGSGEHVDSYLVAAKPELITTYLAGDPSRAVPKDRDLAFEQLDDHRWRTLLLMPTAELDASNIAHATARELSGRPSILVELTPEGGEKLAELTSRIVGKKLAIVADGVVIDAPVIMNAITGGSAEISLGANATDADAVALASSLSPG